MISAFRNVKIIRAVDESHFGEMILRENGEWELETVNIDSD